MNTSWRTRGWAALFVLAVVRPEVASAQEGYNFLGTSLIVPNYMQIPVGEWEALESGAYVARTRDGNANWYNPAGLALSDRTSVNASANVYEAVTLDFKTFRTTDRNLRFAALGGFFGIAIAEPITRSPSVRYGFYIAKPLDWTSGTVDGVVAIDPQTEVRLISTAQLAGTEPGIAAGFRINEKLRLGISLGVVTTTMNEAMDGNLRRADTDSVRTVRQTLAQQGSVWSGVARGGLQWNASERLRVGLTLATPGLRIMGSTKFDYTREDHSPTHFVDERFRDTKAKFDYRIPFQLAAGIATRIGRGEVEVQVRQYGATPEYDMISTELAAVRTEQVAGGPAVVTAIVPEPIRNEWRAVTNWSVGGNYILSDVVRLHLGFQSDGSPVAGAGNVLFRKIDLIGGTGGVSFTGKMFSGTLGLGFSTGESTQIPSSIGDEQPTESKIRVTRLRGMYSLAIKF